MTFLDPHASYRRAKEDASRVPEDPHGIILFTLTELERSLRVLAASATAARGLPETHLNRALTATYILQSSLDFELGGEIADNLFVVYEHTRQQLLPGFQGKATAEGLSRAAELIEQIGAAWKGIAPQGRAA